jgi:hypothetical protein
MKTLIVAMLLLLRSPQAATLPQTGSIEGRVFRASNSEPISGVQVTLIPPSAPSPTSTGVAPLPAQQAQQAQQPIQFQLSRAADGQITVAQPNGTIIAQLPAGAGQAQLDAVLAQINPALRAQSTTITDGDGKFSFQNLAPGIYTIRAQRQGYFGPATPQGTYPGGVARSITVEADKAAKAEFGMVQGGVLRGVVRDPDGQIAPNYAVVTARPAYSTTTGRAIWSFTGAMNADDRGEYRWPGFPPGEYYVGVGPRAPGPIANVQDSWARVFYPGVVNPNQARPVTITEGGEVTVDLAAQVKPWGSFKISGLALNPLPNLPPDPATGVVNRAATSIVLMPLDLTPLDNPPTTSWTNLVATNTKANGEFVLSNVDPGRYELYAMAVDNQNRRVWTGHMRVEVRDKDISGLNIPISPGVTLNGEVVVTGGGTIPMDGVRFQLQAMDTLPPQVAMTVGTVPLDGSGKFQIANLSEGRYRMNFLVPPTAYVASVQQGGINVFDDGFVVDAQTAQVPLRIEINTAGQTIEGNVKTSQKEAANALVVIVPAAARRNNPALYKTAVTDDKGRFVIRGVAPGSYTIFAWDFVLPGAYQNSDFLQKYATRGRPLNVQAGNRNDIDLELILRD